MKDAIPSPVLQGLTLRMPLSKSWCPEVGSEISGLRPGLSLPSGLGSDPAPLCLSFFTGKMKSLKEMFPASLSAEFPSLTLSIILTLNGTKFFQCLTKSKAPVVKKSMLCSSHFSLSNLCVNWWQNDLRR